MSALQLESIVYASQQHDHFLPDGNRAGFLIGDGAGVGKGRTIAGCIYENYLKVDLLFTITGLKNATATLGWETSINHQLHLDTIYYQAVQP